MANAWLDHVKTVRAVPENKGKSFKEILILAKKSYKKVASHVSEKVSNPISKTKTSKRSFKKSRKNKKSRKSRRKSRKSRRR
tara:strand:+ start:5308 stop:5553 length:246 start_codon:yes stop_codon:yes gene_type:complete